MKDLPITPITGCQKCGQNVTSSGGCYCREEKPQGEGLKACPYCNGTVKLLGDPNDIDFGHYTIHCDDCMLGMESWGKDLPELIKRWNTRADSGAVLDLFITRLQTQDTPKTYLGGHQYFPAYEIIDLIETIKKEKANG